MSENGSAGVWFIVVQFPGDIAPTTVKKCKSTRHGRALREARRFAYDHKIGAHVTVAPSPRGVDLTAAPAAAVVE